MSATTLTARRMNTDTQKRQEAEERIIDTLVAWKNHTDELAKDTAAARAAVKEAKDLEIWKDRGYSCFRDWLKDECGITLQWAYALISSAKSIAQIEEAAEGSKKLSALVRNKKNSQAFHSLSDRSIKRLNKLKPKQAAQVALTAIEKSGGKSPTASVIEAEIERIIPKPEGKPEPAPEPKSTTKANGHMPHPALIAMDTEWAKLKKELSYLSIKPLDVYNRLRKSVEAAV